MVSVSFGPVAPTLEERRRLLKTEGPLIDIIVRREPGAAPEDGVPDFLETRVLIDSGASNSCIDYRIAHALKLRETNQTNVTVVGTSVLVTVHLAWVAIPSLGFEGIMELYASKITRPKYNGLIGRAFLTDYGFHFDGPNGVFHIDVPAAQPLRLDHDDDVG